MHADCYHCFSYCELIFDFVNQRQFSTNMDSKVSLFCCFLFMACCVGSFLFNYILWMWIDNKRKKQYIMNNKGDADLQTGWCIAVSTTL